MRIMFNTNMPGLSVGYSKIVETLVPEINKVHKSALTVNYGLEGYHKIDWWKKIPIYGKGFSGFDESIIVNNVRDFNADCLISIYDAWAYNSMPGLLTNNRIPWIPWCPVDTDELNPHYIENLKHAFKIIPMSQHSEDCIKKVFPDKTLPYIFPGVHLNVFKPLWKTKEEKNLLKEKLGFSKDVFLIGLMGDIKYFRKSWAENLEGIKVFRDRYPDIKLGVYIHTSLRPTQSIDFNIQALVDKLGLDDITRIIDPYTYLKGVSDEEMTRIYNALDVYCCASRGEGAGMMYLEAACCGTPSIGTNFSSMKQAIKNGVTGYLVEPYCYVFEQSIARKVIPNVFDIGNKLKKIYDKGSVNFKDDCVSFGKSFSWDKSIKEQWLPLMKKLEHDINDGCLKIPEVSDDLKKSGGDIFIL